MYVCPNCCAFGPIKNFVSKPNHNVVFLKIFLKIIKLDMGNISKHAASSTGWMTAQEFWPTVHMQAMREASRTAQLVKNPPAMQGTWVRLLGPKYPLEKEMATYSSILAWKIPCTEEPSGLQSMRPPESDSTTKTTTTRLRELCRDLGLTAVM